MSGGPARGHRPAEICLVSREVYPLTGGGIGSYVTALAGVLRHLGQVRVVTSSAFREKWDALTRGHDQRLPDGLLWTFVPEPSLDELDDWLGFHHCWGARVLEALRREYGRFGPDLIEFPDYHAEATATAQAKRAGDPMLRNTRVVVRAHTSFEMCRLLDGFLGTDTESETVFALEREALRLADALVWAGGDVLGTYERYYGVADLPAGRRIRHPLSFERPAAVDESNREIGYPVRLLYVGRLERRKGVQDLLRALTTNDSDGWQLTLVGGDTETGPLGGSQRAQLELMALGDSRVRFLDQVPRDALGDLIRAHDVFVMPSRWECWPTVVLEALSLNRPVVGTPTGGMLEMIQAGRSGWLSRTTGADALREVLDGLIGEPERVGRLIRSGEPRRAGEELTRNSDVLNGYAALLDEPPAPARTSAPRPARRRVQPLVSVVIPYFRMARFVRETVDSVERQTYPAIETIVVNDGSFAPEDGDVLDELEGRPRVRVLTQVNHGLGGARNAGIAQSRGRYVLPLDADNLIEPTFVARCVELLEADADLAYVTSWSQYVDEANEPIVWPVSGEPRGFHPIGNATDYVEMTNTAGDALAVIPRRVFDLGYRYSADIPICEDWTLYRALHRAGRYGIVIPERLVRYRIRPDSMYQTGGQRQYLRVRAEATAQLREEAIPWMP